MFNVCLVLAHLLIHLTTVKPEVRLEPGVPLPHAQELERMIRANLFPNKKDDESFVEYFGGYVGEMENETLVLLENLDFAVLDKDGLKNILALIMRRDAMKSTRRQKPAWEQDTPLVDKKGVHIANRTMKLMQQSIYATRYMIEKTKPIRKMYKDDYIFQIAIMYGNLLELRSKAANALSTMAFLLKPPMDFKTTKFARFLWIYERLLAIHTDVTSNVQRMFLRYAELHRVTTVQTTEDTETTDEY